jgi:hypothetical protein
VILGQRDAVLVEIEAAGEVLEVFVDEAAPTA